MALGDINQNFAPQATIGMTDNVEFDTMTPATKELLRAKTKAEKVIAYYGLMVPNAGNPQQPYNVNNKATWEKLGVGKVGDCVEPVYTDSMNGDTVPVKMVSPKEEHVKVLTDYCRSLGLGLVEELDRAVKTIKNIGGARNALTKLNAMGLPASQFAGDPKDVIDTSDLELPAETDIESDGDILDTNDNADESNATEQGSDDTTDEPVDTVAGTTSVDGQDEGDAGAENSNDTETGPVQEQSGADTKGRSKNGNGVSKLPTKLTNKSSQGVSK